MTEKSKAKQNKDSALSYSDAMSELEEILHGIETGETDIDVLSEKVRRALELVKLCRSKLRSTDEEIKKVITEFKSLQEEVRPDRNDS